MRKPYGTAPAFVDAGREMVLVSTETKAHIAAEVALEIIYEKELPAL